MVLSDQWYSSDVLNMALVKFVLQKPYEPYVHLTPLSSYISPWVLTELLLPVMRKTAQEPSADVRIVNVSPLSTLATKKLMSCRYHGKGIGTFQMTLVLKLSMILIGNSKMPLIRITPGVVSSCIYSL